MNVKKVKAYTNKRADVNLIYIYTQSTKPRDKVVYYD